jgi:hypothetical protein
VKDCANQEQLEASSSFCIVLVNKEKRKEITEREREG